MAPRIGKKRTVKRSVKQECLFTWMISRGKECQGLAVENMPSGRPEEFEWIFLSCEDGGGCIKGQSEAQESFDLLEWGLSKFEGIS